MRAIESRPSADFANPLAAGALTAQPVGAPAGSGNETAGSRRCLLGEFMIDVGAVRGAGAAVGSEPALLAVGRRHRKALALPEAYGLDR